MKEPAKSFKDWTTIGLSVLILFFILNVLCYFLLPIQEKNILRESIASKFSVPPQEFYPKLSREQVEQLLWETWSRPLVYEPFTQFKERPYDGTFVKVSEHGFRFVKNQGPWPPDPGRFNVFVFGGSTTFGYGVRDEETLVSYLQDFFAASDPVRKVSVYNFGRGYYFSPFERVLFERLLTSGARPAVAIFIDGINEFFYAGSHSKFFDEFTACLEPGRFSWLHSTPLILVLEKWERSLREKKESRQDKKEPMLDPRAVQKSIDLYTANKRIIEAISKDFGIHSYFVWQPAPTYQYDLKNHQAFRGPFGPHLRSKYGYPEIEQLWKGGFLGDHFLWLGDMQKDTKERLYIDLVHYTPKMNQKIAERIFKFVAQKEGMETVS